jgi:hypothetical protein
LRKDVEQEHGDAEDIDYAGGIGVPKGHGISGGDHRRANKACHELTIRARAVRANPTAFSKYTLEFVNELYATWPRLADPTIGDEALEESEGCPW